MNIVPGASFGAVKLGDALPQFAGRAPADADFADVSGQRVRTCGGGVAGAWLDDVRLAPDCVKLDGNPLRRDITLDALKARFGNCRDLLGSMHFQRRGDRWLLVEKQVAER